MGESAVLAEVAQSSGDFSAAGTGPPDPDQPAWGPLAGVSVWVSSVVAIAIVPIIAVVVWYIISKARGAEVPGFQARDELIEWLKSPRLLLVQVASTLVAHAVTLALCWAVVTNLGTLRFWSSLGWHWAGHSKAGVNFMLLGMAIGFGPLLIAILARLISPRLGVIPLELLYPIAFLATAIGLVMAWRRLRPAGITSEQQVTPLWYWVVFSACVIVTLVGVTQVLSRFLPQSEENAFTELLKSSREVRVAIAVLATFSAPIVEEVIYRGVLFSALRSRTGVAPAVVLVTMLFAGVHFLQYWGAWVTISGLIFLSLILTLVRARTGSILPSVTIHFVNNAFFSLLIVANKG